MEINFFDNPEETPKMREEVRFNDLGIHIYEDGRRVAVGFDITPFIEKPSIMVYVVNGMGQEVATLSVIDALKPNFSLVMHLRDKEISNPYTARAILYYSEKEPNTDEKTRTIVDEASKEFMIEDRPGI